MVGASYAIFNIILDSQNTDPGKEPTDISGYLIGLVCQGTFFFSIVIFIDMRLQVSFKGKDNQ